MRRRLIAVAIGAVVVVLLLLAVRGCLDARKERSYENYLRDLSALVTTSDQLSANFFDRLRDPADASKIAFQDQIGSSRGTGEDLYTRAQGLDSPGELAAAQEDLELAFELRRDGLASIAEQIPTALGDEGRQDAVEQIVLDMREFLASDVLYARAQDGIEQVLTEQELPGEVPESVFLPATDPWLDDLELGAVLSGVAGDTGAAGDATRGTELSSTALRPGNVPLTADAPNTAAQVAEEVEVAVLNGGAQEEVDVVVSFELTGGLETIEGQTTIPRIDAAATEAATIPIVGEVPSNEDLTLTVTVLPVPGETIVDNNQLIYPVLFE